MTGSLFRPLRVAALSALVALHAARTGNAQQRQPVLDSATRELSRGNVDQARRLATDYTSRHPDEAPGWLLLGQALVAGPSPSRDERLRSLWAFRKVTELAPQDPEGWYQYGNAGLRAGNADGERVARIGLQTLLGRDPLYRDAWQRWLLIYRNDHDRRDMRAILSSHAADQRVRVRIARLLIEEGQYELADSILSVVEAADSTDGSAYALAAQSAFENGRAGAGERYFGRALALAARDADNILWAQAIGVASPGEIASWRAGVPPDRRSAWFASFWWRRSSNLFDGIGPRLSEHFQRLKLARREFTLTQPLFDYQRDQQGRSQHAAPSAAEQVFYHRCEARWFPGGPTRLIDEARSPDIMPGVDRDNPDVPGHLVYDEYTLLTFGAMPNAGQADMGVATPGLAAEIGLDDRGLLLLRHGAPRSRTIGAPNTEDRFCVVPSLELWDYADIGPVRFFRPEDVSILQRQGESRTTGSIVMRPMNDRQFEATWLGMTTDNTSAPASLRFTAWFASFPTDDPQRNMVYAIASADTIALAMTGSQLLGPTFGQHGVAVIEAPVERYSSLVHAQNGAAHGRLVTEMAVRRLGTSVAFSDLLLADRWAEIPTSRADMLAHASRDLRFRIGSSMRVYGELARRGDVTLSRYRVRYELMKTDAPAGDSRLDRLTAALRAEYNRELNGPPAVPIAEWVDINLALEMDPGRYLLRVTILDGEARMLGRSHVVIRLFR